MLLYLGSKTQPYYEVRSRYPHKNVTPVAVTEFQPGGNRSGWKAGNRLVITPQPDRGRKH